MDGDEKLMTHQEVCAMLGVSRQTLWTWRKERDFPTAMWDMRTRSLKFDRAQVKEWRDKNDD